MKLIKDYKIGQLTRGKCDFCKTDVEGFWDGVSLWRCRVCDVPFGYECMEEDDKWAQRNPRV